MVGRGAGAFVEVGRIVKPMGVRGEVRIQAMTDVPQRFAPGAVLYVDASPHHVLRSRATPQGLVVLFQDVATRTQAEELRGKVVAVPEQEVPPLPEGSYYHYQVLGMNVYTSLGKLLGDVVEILETGSNDVYVVRRGGDETLIPALADVVVGVDVQQGRMTVDLPQGLEPPRGQRGLKQEAGAGARRRD
ncbi:MAG: 16S rRNA processing protein RimM [Chloroflexi bacterium]|nr:16S rRNA processing protein RimM [Chloroflexota bacterium]